MATEDVADRLVLEPAADVDDVDLLRRIESAPRTWESQAEPKIGDDDWQVFPEAHVDVNLPLDELAAAIEAATAARAPVPPDVLVAGAPIPPEEHERYLMADLRRKLRDAHARAKIVSPQRVSPPPARPTPSVTRARRTRRSTSRVRTTSGSRGDPPQDDEADPPASVPRLTRPPSAAALAEAQLVLNRIARRLLVEEAMS